MLALTALPVAAEAGTMEGAAIGAGSGLLVAPGAVVGPESEGAAAGAPPRTTGERATPRRGVLSRER